MRRQVVLGLLLAVSDWQASPAIYDRDDRRDIFEADATQRRLAASTVLLLSRAQVTSGPTPGTARLATEVYGKKALLAFGESFWSQPSAGICSGALVGPDLILTAGHCIKSEAQCRDISFVFGFFMTPEEIDPANPPPPDVYSGALPEGRLRPGIDPAVIAARDVYGCGELVKSVKLETEGHSEDWALVRLDRRVQDRKPLEVNMSGVLALEASVFAIGYPLGLPVKVAGPAMVHALWDSHFAAYLQALPANSGSPVFNSATSKIEGVLFATDSPIFWREDLESVGPLGRIARGHWAAWAYGWEYERTLIVYPKQIANGTHCTRASMFAAELAAARAASERFWEAQQKLARRLRLPSRGAASPRRPLAGLPGLAPMPFT